MVPLTSDLRLAAAPGNIALPVTSTGLPKDAVANVSQIVTVDRQALTERVGQLSASERERVIAGIGPVLGRP